MSHRTDLQVGLRLSILFFDDDPRRHALFARLARGHRVDHSWFVDDALERLRRRRYDLACLDHDLATEDFARDGREVATAIAALRQARRPRAVVVHSWNPVRSVEMEATLAPLYEAGVTLVRVEFGMFTMAAPGSLCAGAADLRRWIGPSEPLEPSALVKLLDASMPSAVSLEEA